MAVGGIQGRPDFAGGGKPGSAGGGPSPAWGDSAPWEGRGNANGIGNGAGHSQGNGRGHEFAIGRGHQTSGGGDTVPVKDEDPAQDAKGAGGAQLDDSDDAKAKGETVAQATTGADAIQGGGSGMIPITQHMSDVMTMLLDMLSNLGDLAKNFAGIETEPEPEDEEEASGEQSTLPAPIIETATGGTPKPVIDVPPPMFTDSVDDSAGDEAPEPGGGTIDVYRI